ncbi:hypothetical protein GYMLUDRAFT_50875 [Collybiopsis luxurians FD-317 M1]|uniref:tyrosinase n=1 Tax=Collybiopsis luxurians FD-317 M1 TaxID=944289 RepID=A0A0D0AL52_9AGAR|nr:hypothetical protein GYMLUDRAFT_50875 [Collybiopsis luxurians FD-317 M1]
MSFPVPITGRQNSSGVFPRYSIEELQSDHPDQFALFIFSYLVIQNRDVPSIVRDFDVNNEHARSILDALIAIGAARERSPPMSFAELAGIHGLPYKEWPGDPDHDKRPDFNADDPKDKNPKPHRFGGYCNHGSVLFPSWHRAYMLAIEQSIGDVAELLAQNLEMFGLFKPGRWTTAADQLRFPWWDWAEEKVAKEGLPPVLYEDTVKIRLKEENSTFTLLVDNPLAYFPFQTIPPGFADRKNQNPSGGDKAKERPKDGNYPDDDDPNAPVSTAYFSKWMKTVRYGPRDDPAPYPKSDNQLLNDEMKQQAPCIRHRVASLFALPPSNDPGKGSQIYDEFSNHTTQSSNKLHYYNADTLEGVHDSIHDIVGGNGHIGFPDYAGFDPLFFLHHCNVDRLYALWEYVYPEACYIGNGEDFVFTQNTGSYALVYNQQLLPDTELAPFRIDSKKYWTSDQARYFNKNAYPKHYTYPKVAGEIDITQPIKDEKQREDYRELLQIYYGLVESIIELPMDKISAFAVRPLPGRSPITGGVLYRADNVARVVIGIQTPEFAFDGPYSIQVRYKDSHNRSQYVGSISVFARDPESSCENCKRKRQVGTIIHGIIVVPPNIIKDVNKILESAQGVALSSSIADELKKRLTARILDRFKNEIANAEGGPSTVPHDEALDVLIRPQITLASSYVAHHDEKKKGPAIWDSWHDHGDIFEPHLDRPGWKLSQRN